MSKYFRYSNLALALVMVVALFAVQPAAAKPNLADNSHPAFIPGEVVVEFARGKNMATYGASASALAGKVNAQVTRVTYNLALLSFAPDADVESLAKQLSSTAGVVSASPDYVWAVPDLVTSTRPAPPKEINRRTSDGKNIEISTIDTGGGGGGNPGKSVSVFPNDPYLWNNWGWSEVGADVVWSNKTASAGVCLLDTGVDYTHPDLKSTVIKGYDFINNDADPMDDYGHGTHVAGIIAAAMNNKTGLAGVSNGKVVAVKVLGGQGWGSFYNIAAGIYYCADRTDVKVLSMSLGGSSNSNFMYNAINYAVNVKGKLLVAAAGNGNPGSDTAFYPAYFASYSEFSNEVLAVAAEDSPYLSDGTANPNYQCRASYSNYGAWVSVVAPGTRIFSTLPYSTPFYMNYYYGSYPQYDYLSGTSMATPFVAASAARRWGYTPTSANYSVGYAVKNDSPWTVNADGTCWPSTMSGIHYVRTDALLDRGAAFGYIYNANTGLPLPNAQLQMNSSSTGKTQGTGAVSATPNGGTYYSALVQVINLPVDNYFAKVNAPGFTAGTQWAFFHANGGSGINLMAGAWNYIGRTGIPSKSGNFDVVMGWVDESDVSDLDINVWLPLNSPGQPASFIVGPEGNSYGYLENDTTGTLIGFPYAIYNRDTIKDWVPIESTTISKRYAHAPISANASLPYYPGTYVVGVTDWGQTIGSDPALYWAKPYVAVWKDGKLLDEGFDWSCYTHSWYPFEIISGTSGSVSVYFLDDCTDTTPYAIGFSKSITKGAGTSISKK